MWKTSLRHAPGVSGASFWATNVNAQSPVTSSGSKQEALYMAGSMA